ncbi:MAG: SDR family oxidoreductase [Deltaproteobacteria bacterium]|nr:SDR family oxidoreductase [Deltaproteobacteria bacterium]
MGLDGKRVVVVGGTSGIGFGVARAALAAGASEVVVASRSRERVAAAVARLEAPGRARGIATDATVEGDVAALFAAVGEVDHVVMTCAELRWQPIAELAVDDAMATLRSKLLAGLLLAKHGAPRLRAGGSLTLTTGVATDRPNAGGALVSLCNGGLEGLARQLAVELAPIRVNALSPGIVDTELWDGIAGDEKAARLAGIGGRMLARRVGSPDDLARAALFLMESGFVTGETLHVDGGYRLV